MKLIKQYPKVKKSEKLKKKFLHDISKLKQSEQNRLLDNFREILDKKKDTTTHFCVIVSITLLTVLTLLIHKINLAGDFVLIG